MPRQIKYLFMALKQMIIVESPLIKLPRKYEIPYKLMKEQVK